MFVSPKHAHWSLIPRMMVLGIGAFGRWPGWPCEWNYHLREIPPALHDKGSRRNQGIGLGRHTCAGLAHSRKVRGKVMVSSHPTYGILLRHREQVSSSALHLSPSFVMLHPFSLLPWLSCICEPETIWHPPTSGSEMADFKGHLLVFCLTELLWQLIASFPRKPLSPGHAVTPLFLGTHSGPLPDTREHWYLGNFFSAICTCVKEYLFSKYGCDSKINVWEASFFSSVFLLPKLEYQSIF